MKKPFVISISSVSGGGKTALSVALHKSLPDSFLFHFDDFDGSNIYPSDFYDWSRRGGDVEEFDCPGMQMAVNATIHEKNPDGLFWIFHSVDGTPVFVMSLTLLSLSTRRLISLWRDEFCGTIRPTRTNPQKRH